MADYIVKDTELTSVANAIRTAGGTSSLLTFPNGFTNAINNISGGGGGGSSDFSTAEVTIVNNLGMPIAVFGAIVTEEDDEFFTINNWSVLYSDRIQVVMYKGLAYGGLDGPFSTVNTTGDISWNGDTLTITGDGTITIS